MAPELSRNAVLKYGGIALLVLVLAPFVVFAVPQVAGAQQGFVVLSSSMSPAIQAGDVVIVDGANPAAIEEGDVITFEPPADHQIDAPYVTHRVVEVVERNGDTYFRTKGDANEEPDQALVPASNLVGVVAFHIPLIGYVIQFAGSESGILVFIVVPSILLIVNEVWTLWVAASTESGSDSESTSGDGVDDEELAEWEFGNQND